MTAFSFPAWYARMGYADYHGGQRDCARDLGVTASYIGYLMRGKRTPNATLVKLCQVIEDTTLLKRWLKEAEAFEEARANSA